MTQLDLDQCEDYPHRIGFKNFTWTHTAVVDWEEVWNAMWHLGIKWEWQNIDQYVRRMGETYNRFVVHNDACRLDMAFPLPQVDTINKMANWLLGAHIDDSRATDAIYLIRKWIKTYVE